MPREYPQPDEPQAAGNPGMGCIIIACALAMFTGIASYAIWAGLKQDRDIAKFTDEKRTPVPSDSGTTEEWNALKARLQAFEKSSVEADKPATLELTPRDLNLMVSNSTLLLDSREMVYFESVDKDGPGDSELVAQGLAVAELLLH